MNRLLDWLDGYDLGWADGKISLGEFRRITDRREAAYQWCLRAVAAATLAWLWWWYS